MVKRIAQKGLSIIASLMILFSISSINVQAATQEASVLEVTTEQTEFQPYSDIIRTYYRTNNGVLQQRRWNVTKGYWIDDDWVNAD